MIDLGKARQIISASTTLTPIERAEWMQLLPSMSDTQVLELMKILTPPVPIPQTPQVLKIPQPAPQQSPRPAAPVFKMPDYKEKELQTSKPARELEITEHATPVPQAQAQTPKMQTPIPPPLPPTPPKVQTPTPTQQPQSQTPSPLSKVSPTIIPTAPLPPIANPTIQVAANINMQHKEHIIAPPKFADSKHIKELIKNQPTPPATPAPPIQPVHSPTLVPTAPAKPQLIQTPTKPVSLESIISAQMHQQPKSTAPQRVEPVPIISEMHTTQKPVAQMQKGVQFTTPQDFSKVSADFLHGSDPVESLKNLMKSIIEVSKHSKFFIVVANFEQSPLYKTYVNTGLILLNSSVTAQASDVFENYINNARMNNQPYLTRVEFESFTDFRKDLDRLVI